MPTRRWPLRVGWWLAALLLSNILILFSGTPLLRAAGILLLSGTLPGLAALSALFPAERDLDGWERQGLGFALGLFASMALVWVYMLVPGRMQAYVLLGLLDAFALALAGLAFWRRARFDGPASTSWRPGREGLLGLALLAGAALLLFLNLGQTEYDYDETPVLDDAVASILGNDGAVFALRKGPAQIVIAATAILLGDNLAEGFVRLPFALAGLATAVVCWRLGRRLLGSSAALAVLALWLAEGMHLGESRWVQYQNLVLLTALCAVWCFVRAARAEGGLRVRFQFLGAFFFAAGLFSHFDGAFVAPVLAMLWLWMERGSLRSRRTWLVAVALAGLIVIVAAPFYVALSQQGGAGAYFDRYFFGLRVGRGPFNNMPAFFARMAVLDAPVWLLAVASGLLLSGLLIAKRLWRRRWVGALWCAALTAAVAGAVSPGVLMVAGVDLAFVPYTLLLLILALAPAAGLTPRVLGVWGLSAWLFPAFWMQVPGDHYFPSMAAWTLLSVWGWALPAGVLARRMPARVVRSASAVAAALACFTGAAYVFVMLVSTQPEYAMQYPDAAPRPLALFVGERPALLYGAYPHQSGWRAVAVLYSLGVLHGEYESNEMHAIGDWYLSTTWWPAQRRPRYYLQVIHPFAPILASDVPADLPQTRWLIGQITVAGEPHMLIYQLPGTGAPPAPQTWAVEELSDDWEQLALLPRLVSYREQGRDDSAFYAVARRLEAEGLPGDVVLVDGALGLGLLARFYRGDLPLVTSLDDPRAKDARRVWGVYWASADRAGEREVAERDCPATSRWFANVRLTLNGAGETEGQASADAVFRDAAQVRTVALKTAAARGSIVCVRIDWEVLAPTPAPYKLFVHLIGPNSKVAAQADTEPLAGLKPSSAWRAGERFSDQVGIALPADLPLGNYRVLFGLYSERDGSRLPASTAAGRRYTDDAVALGTITIR